MFQVNCEVCVPSLVQICLNLGVASRFPTSVSKKVSHLVEKKVNFAGEKVQMSKKVEVIS